LLKRGSYKPVAGWGRFALQVFAASALLAVFLMWAAGAFPWIALRAHALQRAGWMATMLAASGAIYFVALWAAGVNLRQFVTR
jgi:putative peptidoglycan lipid II flippase